MTTAADLYDDEPAFWCDAMLGGLARWLRAAGYDAAWIAGIEDTDLIRRALADARILLTADTQLVRHGAVRSGRVRAVLLPSGLGKFDQLQFVFRRLGLARRPTRCMACGGLLEAISRQAAQPEAPPRSFAWCDEFFRCQRCAKLFWRGTHWRRIVARLDTLY